VQELTSAGGRTVWGDPADVGAAVGGASFDVVLDNNGKDLDAVKYVRDSSRPLCISLRHMQTADIDECMRVSLVTVPLCVRPQAGGGLGQGGRRGAVPVHQQRGHL
jgi:hypothetical protein